MAINCATLPATLLESELFGYVKGAFTGADHDKHGLLLDVRNGTVLLDEVGELPLELQPKLLRVLQEKEVRPVGGLTNIPFHARVIASTNRDLKALVEEGRFRKDLYFRLSVFPIQVPPLRERRDDIPALAGYFLSRLRGNHPGFLPDTYRYLDAYHWPGNVRELQNWVEYAVVLAGGEPIAPYHLPHSAETLAGDRRRPRSIVVEDLPTCDELQSRYIRHVLERTGNNRTEASRILGISISTLWRRFRDETDGQAGKQQVVPAPFDSSASCNNGEVEATDERRFSSFAREENVQEHNPPVPCLLQRTGRS